MATGMIARLFEGPGAASFQTVKYVNNEAALSQYQEPIQDLIDFMDSTAAQVGLNR